MTCRWVCGTSMPAMIRPTRAGENACCWAWPIRWATVHEVGREVGLEVDPVVDLGDGHHERVARAQRGDRQEGDAARRRATRTGPGSSPSMMRVKMLGIARIV